MADAIITMLTLVLFASGFGRLHRLARARREATDRALVVAHDEWAEAHGGTTLDPGEIGAHAQALLSSESRALLLRLRLPDQVDRAVSLDLTGDLLQLSATDRLTSRTAITVLADAALTLASSIEAIGPGCRDAGRLGRPPVVYRSSATGGG